ncbi:11284_t:CDS:2, partial [Scutellospora calospora]
TPLERERVVVVKDIKEDLEEEEEEEELEEQIFVYSELEGVREENYKLDWLGKEKNIAENRKKYFKMKETEKHNLWPVTCLVSLEKEKQKYIHDLFDYYYENEVRLGINYEIGELKEDQKRHLQQLLDQNVELCAQSIYELGRTNITRHTIPTQKTLPIWQQIEIMLVKEIIRPSSSPWTSPVVLVKQGNRKMRFCIDYRKLNAVTVRDNYPLPRVDELLDALNGASWFSTLDLASGYWQVEMLEEDKEKTAFISPYGVFEFNVIPFGLMNAPATFQRLIDQIFNDLIEHLAQVFERLKKVDLKIKPQKCHFTKKELKFLGYVVSARGISTDPNKVRAVQEYPRPKNLRQLHGFLGL